MTLLAGCDAETNDIPGELRQAGGEEAIPAGGIAAGMRPDLARPPQGVARLRGVVLEHQMLDHGRPGQRPQIAFQGKCLLLPPVDRKQGEPPLLLVDGGHRLQQRHAVELAGGVAGAGDLQIQHIAATEAGGVEEGNERGLPPGAATPHRGDGGDGVHELSQAGDRHAIGVLEQRDQQAPDDQGIRQGVGLFAQRRRHPPRCAVQQCPVRFPRVVPDVPLVK